MTPWQVLELVFVLLCLAAVFVVAVGVAAWLINPWVYRWEARRHRSSVVGRVERSLGHDLRNDELRDHCNVYRMHPPVLAEVRPRRGDAA